MTRILTIIIALCCFPIIVSAQQLDIEGDLIITEGKNIKAPAANIETIETEHLNVKDRAIINAPITTGKLTTENADILVSGNVYAENGMDLGQDYSIKVKTLTFNTPTAPLSTISFPHGLNSADFVRVTGVVNYNGAGAGISTGYARVDNYEFYIDSSEVNLFIRLTNNSDFVLNKECTITIYYKS